jgi:hypothetical protein
LLLGVTNNLHVVHSASQLRGRTDSNNQDRMMMIMIVDKSQLQNNNTKTDFEHNMQKMHQQRQQQQQQQQQTEALSDLPTNSGTSEDSNRLWPCLSLDRHRQA